MFQYRESLKYSVLRSKIKVTRNPFFKQEHAKLYRNVLTEKDTVLKCMGSLYIGVNTGRPSVLPNCRCLLWILCNDL